ncbi:FIST signal transduction protein [Synechococcus elongatus]|uniref:FIST signal transduction protein n=1 Tax=Synechococcus elongatus TaxID=32046 RepID=UPI0030CDA599
MQWSCALSTRPSLELALQEVVTRALADFGVAPDLGLIFVSASFASDFPRLLPLLQEQLQVPRLLGCCGGGIVGTQQGVGVECEQQPALTLLLASLPGVRATPFHLSPEDLPDLDSPPQAWIEAIGVNPADNPQFLLMVDPFSAKIEDLLQGLDFAYPESVKVGGLSSGVGTESAVTSLFFQDRQVDGVIGLALSGNIQLQAIVAQGCRPVGPLWHIAAADRNILRQLQTEDEEPISALQALQSVLQQLPAESQRSLCVGLACNAFQTVLQPGDFLIRNLLGFDPRTGAVAIGDRVRVGQRLQLHVRDAQTAADDLERQLGHWCQQSAAKPAAALLFSCLGRGKPFYQQANFESQLIQHYLSELPLAGFFCNGEIGPIAGSSYLHGYTSVLALLSPKTR